MLKKSDLTLGALYSDPDAITEPSRLDAVTVAAWRDRTGARVTAEAQQTSTARRRKAGNTLH